MTTPKAMPVAVTGLRRIPTGPTHPTGVMSGVTGGCSNCGSVRSVRVLPDGRFRCGCGHRWTPAAGHTSPPTSGHPADGAP